MKRILSTILFLLAAAGASAATNAVPWRVPAYTITARDMGVREALDTFGVAEGIPVIMSQAVGGSFSGNFTDVPAAEFLDRIATVNNLSWYYDGAAIYVTGAGETLSTLIDLAYMKADEVTAMLRELGVEDSRFPIKTAQNGELIMVTGPPRYVQLVAEMIAKADKLREQRTFNEVETRLFPLEHTWADDVSFSTMSSESSSLQIRGVASLLEEIMLTGNGSKVREGTNKVENADRLQEAMNGSFQPVIRPENRLNAVLVRDVAVRMPMYEKLIRELDVPQKLVEIGITVLEMTKGDALDWQLSIKAAARDGDFSGGVGQNAGNLFTEDGLGGKGLAGALTYLGDRVTVSASLTALRAKNKARSISRTSVVTLNNLAAEISDEQSYHARVAGENVASLESVSAGTRLQLKPRIIPSASTNGQAQVWVSMVLSDGGFESVTVDAMPMNRSSSLTTQAAIYEDESILLAGYFRDIDENAGWGIPYLRDIPFIGWIFGGTSVVHERVQRLFILTPHIISLEAEDLLRLQATKHRDIQELEAVSEDAEESDDVRELREENRRERDEIRDERQEEALELRRAEIERARQDREAARERRRAELEEAEEARRRAEGKEKGFWSWLWPWN